MSTKDFNRASGSSYYPSNTMSPYRRDHHLGDTAAMRSELDIQNTRVVEAENDELRHSLKVVENQLARSRENHYEVGRRFKETQDELDNYKQEVNRLDGQTHSQRIQIETLNSKLTDATNTQVNIIQHSRSKLGDFENQLYLKHEETDKLRTQIYQRDDNLKRLTLANDSKDFKSSGLDYELQKKSRELESVKRRLETVEAELDNYHRTRRSEGTALLELEHLKADNQRLLDLLSSTSEYGSMRDFATDSKEIRYMPGKARATPSSTKSKKKSKPTVSKSGTASQEIESWIPAEAFKIAHAWRNKSAGEITEANINSVLRDLNRVWYQREQSRIQRIQNDAEFKVSQMKRKSDCQAPFNQREAEKQIERQKEEIKKLKAENRELSGLKSTLDKCPEGSFKVDTSMKYASSLQQAKRCLEDENQSLRYQLDRLQDAHRNKTSDRQHFLSGSGWMAKRMLDQLETLSGKQHLAEKDLTVAKLEYDRTNDVSVMTRTQQHVLDALERNVEDVKRTVGHLLDGCLREEMNEGNHTFESLLEREFEKACVRAKQHLDHSSLSKYR